MANFVAIYDACVLYPAPLRDLLVHLALTGLFRAKWTGQIHDEWTRSVLTSKLSIPMSSSPTCVTCRLLLWLPLFGTSGRP